MSKERVPAEVHVLHEGYVQPGTASTVGFVRDGDQLIIIDPGMVRERTLITKPLEDLGFTKEHITDVVFSHHHPDHTLNAALFSNARFHDHWAIYQGDEWASRPAEGFSLSPSVRLIETPGHSPQDITTLVKTARDLIAFTHLWWSEDGPPEDPYATDASALHRGRERVLEIATLIVPGHGPMFRPGPDTPR